MLLLAVNDILQKLLHSAFINRVNLLFIQVLLNIFKFDRLRNHLLESIFDKLLGVGFFEVAHLVFVESFPNLAKRGFKLRLLFILLNRQNRLLVLADDLSMVDNFSRGCGTSVFVKSSWINIFGGRRSPLILVPFGLRYLCETNGGIKFDDLLLFTVKYNQVITAETFLLIV